MAKIRKRNYVLLAGGLLILLLAAALDTRLTVRSYTVETEKVSAPVRLAVLTDLHSCSYGAQQRDLVDAVVQAAPDAVLLVGDIVFYVLPQEYAWTTVSHLVDF